MPGWITGGWYHPTPPPAQQRAKLIQPSTGDSPPPRLLAAVVGASVALWVAPASHAQRAAGVAPLVPLVVNAPPPSSRAAFYAVRSTWGADEWRAQSAAPAASIPSAPPAVDYPPPVRYAPVIAADPQRPIYGLAWQYGRLPSGGAAAPPIVNAPPLASLAPFYALRAAWTPVAWRAQRASPSATTPNSLGPQVDAPPLSNWARDYALRAAWPVDAWKAERQSAAATTVSGPSQVFVARGTLANPVSIAWQFRIEWAAQRAVATLVQPYSGDEPPGTFAVPDLEAFGLYPKWSAQRAGGVAAVLPQPIVNPPTPSSFALAYAVRFAWPKDEWSAQRPSPVAALPSAPGPQVDNPPPSSRAGGLALRAAWPSDAWGAERPAPTAPFVLAPPSAPVPSSQATLYAIRSSWIDPAAAWSSQSEEPVAAVLPLPEVDAPPPAGWRIAYQLVASWQPDGWGTQKAAPFVATATVAPGLASPERVIVVFDGRRVPLTFDSRNIPVANDTRRITLQGIE